MKKYILIPSLMAMAFMAHASDTMACSREKLAILKMKCDKAENHLSKDAYCKRFANPHSIKFDDERKNYNVKPSAQLYNSQPVTKKY